MNTIPIRIYPETKKELDRLMRIEIKEVFDSGDTKKGDRILRKGYSYAEFIDILLLQYKQSKQRSQSFK